MRRLLIPAFAFAATPLTALAQNDECATALAVTIGAYAFDTTAATLSPEPWPCALNGGPDLWYRFTATTTGNVTVSTCGTVYDTALEAFSGACGSLVSLICNDDACNFQSTILFAATAGQSYFVRVGGYNGSTGAGTIQFSDGSPVLNATNGNYYAAVSMPGITWTQARQAAAAASHMGTPGHLVTLNSQQENDFVFSALGLVNNHWIGGFQNLMSPTYSEPGGGWEWITGEPFTYTNWLPGEPNNTGAFGAEDYLELLQSAQFGTTWNDVAEMEHPAGYIIEFPVGNIGSRYCTANVNSTGNAAEIGASGSSTVTMNNLTLQCSSMPNNSFAFFLTSLAAGMTANPGGSQGILCLGGSIGRYVGAGQIKNSGATGSVSLLTNLNQHPTPQGLVVVQPGQTWRFQCWFRDVSMGSATSNFSDGFVVTFQ